VGPVVEAAQWRYRECLRNHAARLGAHVLDGCCEFMPSGSDGAAALACAACGCHRSFHRREAIPGGVAPAVAVSPSAVTPTAGASASANSSRVMPLLLAPPHMHTRPPHVPASPASAPAALTESSSEELRGPAPAHPAAPTTHPPHAQVAVGGSASAPPAPSQKRFRTKFTAEQKDRMREFAHRVGWRIHKPDSDAVDAFCAQVGVSRRVLKVWMHNNKHLAKIPPSPPSSQPPLPHHHDHHPPPPPHHIHHHHPPPPPPQQQQQQQHDA
jgi:ZF-HD class homeobox domain-containing protein